MVLENGKTNSFRYRNNWLDVDDGHKIIEIGCVEIIDRNITANFFHEYVNPKRLIEEKAFEVHGISNESLENKPIFSEIIDKFMDYISDSPLSNS